MLGLPSRVTPDMPRITCAACGGKPVDWIVACNNPVSMGTEFHVGCHGDTDSCEITRQFQCEAGPFELKEGVAFARKRIAAC